MAAVIQKNVGAPRTVTGVQKLRKIVGVAVQAEPYAVIISYHEWEVDSASVMVGPVLNLTKTIDAATLPTAAENEIDGIYTRALNAL